MRIFFCVQGEKQSLRESLKLNIFREAHQCSVMMSQTATRHAAETSEQRTPLFPAEFLNIIFCIFLQMTQSPHPSPLIPPNYHFSSMSPGPTEMGFLGVSKSCHEICLYVYICEGIQSRNHTHVLYTHSNYLLDEERSTENNNVIFLREGDRRKQREIQGSTEDSLSLILPESSPFFSPFSLLLPSQLQQGSATPQL